MSRSAKEFCHGLYGAVRTSVMPMPFTLSLLKTCPRPLICILRTDSLLGRHGQMAWDPLWGTAKQWSHTPRVGAGESRATAATRRVEGASATAQADTDRPDLLGSAVEALEELAAFAAGGAAGDRGRLAPSGIQTVLGVEEPRPMGSPAIGRELRDLIRQMSRANPLWGAPRIHGELLKLGLTVSQATVSKYMVRYRRPPSQAWRAFLANHAQDLVAFDFFTDRRRPFECCVLVVLSHGRRRLVHFNVTEHPTAEWAARQLLEACGQRRRRRGI
jgi:transposase InsO family protein